MAVSYVGQNHHPTRAPPRPWLDVILNTEESRPSVLPDVHCPDEFNTKNASKSQLRSFLAQLWGPAPYIPPEYRESPNPSRDVLGLLAVATKLWLRHRSGRPLSDLWASHPDTRYCGVFVRAIRLRVRGTAPVLTRDNAYRGLRSLRRMLGFQVQSLPPERRYLDDLDPRSAVSEVEIFVTVAGGGFVSGMQSFSNGPSGW
ncbi:hypothetical protein CPLU01_09827 [Colletotrichum plurivorum]|uniref:Uncharacterized protein n=1 Tax=Colletotrichum plurivorum TaxID=2175906 RepID=A0A8H6K7U8_9PEZI|nr:hypothetical protein CPLU01_09827 [Colletotrichum plurivorum]